MKHERINPSNPLVDRLPAPKSLVELQKQLRQRPAKPGNIRFAPASERWQLIGQFIDCFFPTGDQLRFAQDVDVILRAGYVQRDVRGRERRMSKLGCELIWNVAGNEDDGPIEVISVANASGLNGALLGVPQMGKTETVNRVLGLYPQRISHAGMSDQVVWLKIGCPADGSLKSFYLEFFEALDMALAQTTYRDAFGNNNASVEAMPGQVLRLANIHSLGLLVVDDIHALGPPKADDHPILKLLLGLSSVVGVPTMTVGTMAAAESLQSSAQLAFRSVGLGSDCWAPLPFGRQWDDFLSQLWPYQWTRVPTELSDELSCTFFACTQGVLSLVVKLYQRVQAELIRRNMQAEARGQAPESEVITPAFVQDVYQRFFAVCHEHLDALRSGDPRKLRQFADLSPLRGEARKFDEKRRKAKEQPFEPGDEAKASEPKSEDDLLAQHIEEVARAMTREASVSEEEAEKWLADVRKELKGEVANNAREFYRRIEKRIRAMIKTRTTETVRTVKTVEAQDLRLVLDGSRPVSEALAIARLDGPEAIFGRR